MSSTLRSNGGGEPDWWHREHPVFMRLSGFFAGMLAVTVIPGTFAATLRYLFDYRTAADFFPLVAGIFLIPLGLMAVPRTRRFGQYMLFGMIISAIVVIGVTLFVLWVMAVRRH